MKQKCEIQRFKYDLFKGEDLKLAKWLDNMINIAATAIMQNYTEASPENTDDVECLANVMAMRDMPAPLHQIKAYILLRGVAARVKARIEEAEGETEEYYARLQFEAEEATADALRESLIFRFHDVEYSCDCPSCSSKPFFADISHIMPTIVDGEMEFDFNQDDAQTCDAESAPQENKPIVH